MVMRRDTCALAVSMRGITVATSLFCALAAGCATGTTSITSRPVPPDTSEQIANPQEPLGRTPQKAFVFPAIEIVAMDTLVNLGGRQLADPAAYEVTFSTIRKNLRGPWVVDDD